MEKISVFHVFIFQENIPNTDRYKYSKKTFLFRSLVPIKAIFLALLFGFTVLFVPLFSPVMTIYFRVFQKTARQNPSCHWKSWNYPSFPWKSPDKREGGKNGTNNTVVLKVKSLFSFFLWKLISQLLLKFRLTPMIKKI
jgi:hypothetical protein